MNSNELTFEQVDEQIRNVDLSQFQEGGKNYFAASTAKSPEAAIPAICNIYRMVKPILQWIIKILPKKWADIIRTFMSVMDTLCP